MSAVLHLAGVTRIHGSGASEVHALRAQLCCHGLDHSGEVDDAGARGEDGFDPRRMRFDLAQLRLRLRHREPPLGQALRAQDRRLALALRLAHLRLALPLALEDRRALARLGVRHRGAALAPFVRRLTVE